MPVDTAPFALSDTLAAKTDPALIDQDRAHFRAIATSLEHAITELVASLAAARALPTANPDLLAHVVVDEAQELTDAEWQMLLRRCPSRSLTIVGDRAQARHGFAE